MPDHDPTPPTFADRLRRALGVDPAPPPHDDGPTGPHATTGPGDDDGTGDGTRPPGTGPRDDEPPGRPRVP